MPEQHLKCGLIWVGKGLVYERSWVRFLGEPPVFVVSISNEIDRLDRQYCKKWISFKSTTHVQSLCDINLQVGLMIPNGPVFQQVFPIGIGMVLPLSIITLCMTFHNVFTCDSIHLSHLTVLSKVLTYNTIINIFTWFIHIPSVTGSAVCIFPAFSLFFSKRVFLSYTIFCCWKMSLTILCSLLLASCLIPKICQITEYMSRI